MQRAIVMGSVAFDTVGWVERLPVSDSTARVVDLEVAPGGAAGNVALALARLGTPVGLVSIVGEDFGGSAYERALLDAGVDISTVARVPGRTPRAFIFNDRSGSQHVYFHHGDAESRDALPEPVRADLGHFAAGDISTYPGFMRKCDLVSFDPGQETFHRDPAQIEACLPLVHYLFLNEFELAHLGESRGWTPERLLDEGVRVLVESRGAQGARVHRAGVDALDVPAVRARAIDPTGAGDAHRAGFLAAVSRGASVEDAARVGATVAAFAVESRGPQAGIASWKDVESRHRDAFGDWPL